MHGKVEVSHSETLFCVSVDSEDGGLDNDLSQYGSRGFLSKGWPSYDL